MSTHGLPATAPAQAATPQPRTAGWVVPSLSLCQRELVRFVRQRNRIVSALATPIVFWLLMGAGMGSSFSVHGQAPLQYYYPGALVMILLFTAIFSTISIIEDRREGFLQSVLVAPISPMVIVLGKLLGGTILAVGQGLVFLALSPLLGVRFSPESLCLTVAAMFVVSFALTGLGFCIAWRMSSTQGFHGIMMLFLMPMWFLSGALFSADSAWIGIRWAMRLNPLSYGLATLRHALGPARPAPTSFALDWAVSAAFAVVMFLAAAAIARTRISADLQ